MSEASTILKENIDIARTLAEGVRGEYQRVHLWSGISAISLEEEDLSKALESYDAILDLPGSHGRDVTSDSIVEALLAFEKVEQARKIAKDTGSLLSNLSVAKTTKLPCDIEQARTSIANLKDYPTERMFEAYLELSEISRSLSDIQKAIKIADDAAIIGDPPTPQTYKRCEIGQALRRIMG